MPFTASGLPSASGFASLENMRLFQWLRLAAFVGLVLGVSTSTGLHAQGPSTGADTITHRFRARLDDVLDWHDPLTLSENQLATAWQRQGFESSPLYAAADVEGPDGSRGRLVHIGARPYRNVSVQLSALRDTLLIHSGQLLLAENPALSEFELVFPANDSPLTALTERWSAHPSRTLDTRAAGSRVTFTSWSLPSASAVLIQSDVAPPTLRIAGPQRAGTLGLLQTESGLVVHSDLDFLLHPDGPWSLSTEAFEHRFAIRGAKDQVFFQWLDASRTRARFTRRPYSNVTALLTLFSGQLQAEEANLDFENGRLIRATISLYNRGDSGTLTVPEFEKLIQSTGRHLGQALSVSPKPQSPASSSVIRSIGWLWSSPTSVALMEHNDIKARAAKGASSQPEFLRLKLAPAQNRDWSLGVTTVGSTTTTVTKASLAKHVRRTPEGAVFIEGIPMVDQGDKGYCVVASCQRLFEFYRIACDQHELARLVGTTADGGTNARLMEAGLNKIDSRFKTRFKALISPGMDPRDRQKLDPERFTRMIQSSIDEGIPLLWTLQLGRAPEIPPLSANGQVTGGHMRLIIGYDTQTSHVLFTDSWGAGHELKRMPIDGAFLSTDGLYTLTPRTY